MARNGSGTYSLASGNPVVTNTTVSSTWANNTLNDIASALTQSIASDGQTTPTADLTMGGFKHTNVTDALARDQYASFAQVQDNKPFWGGTAGGTADALTIGPIVGVSAYSTGQRFEFVAASANTTTTPTIAVSGLAAKTLVNRQGGALDIGSIQPGLQVIEYDGTNFRLFGIDSKLYIGVASPAYKLDVSDNQNASVGARVQNPNSGSSARAQILLNNDSGGVGSGLFKNSSANSGSPGGVNAMGLYNSSAAPLSFGTNATEGWRIDASNRLLNIANGQENFSYLTSGQTGSGNVTIIFGTAIGTQRGSAYNAATGVFTAPVAGIYLFSVMLVIQQTSATPSAASGYQLIISGNPYAMQFSVPASSIPITQTITVPAVMAQGDTAFVRYIFANPNIAAVGVNSGSTFSGTLLR